MRTDATPRQGSQGKEPPDLFPLLPFSLQGRTESSHNPAGERGQGPHHPESASMGIDQEDKYREWVRGDKGGFKSRHINSRQGGNPQGLLNLVEYDPLPPSGLPVDPSPTPPAASARGIHGQKAHRQLSYTPALSSYFLRGPYSRTPATGGNCFQEVPWAHKPDGFMSKVTAAFLSGNLGAGRPGASVNGNS